MLSKLVNCVTTTINNDPLVKHVTEKNPKGIIEISGKLPYLTAINTDLAYYAEIVNLNGLYTTYEELCCVKGDLSMVKTLSLSNFLMVRCSDLAEFKNITMLKLHVDKLVFDYVLTSVIELNIEVIDFENLTKLCSCFPNLRKLNFNTIRINTNCIDVGSLLPESLEEFVLEGDAFISSMPPKLWSFSVSRDEAFNSSTLIPFASQLKKLSVYGKHVSTELLDSMKNLEELHITGKGPIYDFVQLKNIKKLSLESYGKGALNIQYMKNLKELSITDYETCKYFKKVFESPLNTMPFRFPNLIKLEFICDLDFSPILPSLNYLIVSFDQCLNINRVTGLKSCIAITYSKNKQTITADWTNVTASEMPTYYGNGTVYYYLFP